MLGGVIEGCTKLYVESSRALARKPAITKEVLEFAEQHGAEIVCSDIGSLNGVGRTALQTLIIRVMTAFHALERDLIYDRTMNGRKLAIEKSDKFDRSKNKKIGGRTTVLLSHPNPPTLAARVRELADKRGACTDGSYGWGSIATDLATIQDGETEPMLGHKLSKGTVKSLIEDCRSFQA